MSKYIVDIPDGVEWGVVTCRTEDGFYTRDFDFLEELTSDYINEHYGDLQDDAYNKGYAQCQDDYSDALKHAKDTAYKKGLHDGESKCRHCNEYQRGLNDAWEMAKKISLMSPDEIEKVFPGAAKYNRYNLGYSGIEAIEKLKAYEEKQKTDNCIEIGDEVEWDGDKYIVTYRNMDINTGVIQDYDLMMWDGSVVDHVKKCSFVKTGNHYDISSILKEMQS